MKQTKDFYLEFSRKLERIPLFSSSAYQEYRSEEFSRPVDKFSLTNPGPNEGWYIHQHETERLIPAQGIYEVRNACVFGAGFILDTNSGAYMFDESAHGRLTERYFRDFTNASTLGGIDITPLDQPGVTVIGPGYKVWGHWLVDYLPRLHIAICMMGRGLDGHALVLPDDTPSYALGLILNITGVSRELIRFYKASQQGFSLKNLIYPTFPHEAGLHSLTKDLYSPFSVQIKDLPSSIYVSRREVAASSSARTFPQREAFEMALEKAGFTAVYPENLSLRQQVKIFASAQHIVGEFGSGMHNAVFSRPASTVGIYQMLNPIQLRIAETFRHKSAYLFPTNETELGLPTYHSEVDTSLINEFIEAVVNL